MVDKTPTAPANTGPGFTGQAAREMTSALLAAMRSRASHKSVEGLRGNVTAFVSVMTVPAGNPPDGLCANPGGMPCASLPSPQICVVGCVGLLKSVS